MKASALIAVAAACIDRSGCRHQRLRVETVQNNTVASIGHPDTRTQSRNRTSTVILIRVTIIHSLRTCTCVCICSCMFICEHIYRYIRQHICLIWFLVFAFMYVKSYESTRVILTGPDCSGNLSQTYLVIISWASRVQSPTHKLASKPQTCF